MKSSKKNSGVIEGKGKMVSSNEKIINNELNGTSSSQNLNQKETLVLNPYAGSSNKSLSNLFGSDIGNSISFDYNNNPFIDNSIPKQLEERNNSYSEGDSGENPYSKPNI